MSKTNFFLVSKSSKYWYNLDYHIQNLPIKIGISRFKKICREELGIGANKLDKIRYACEERPYYINYHELILLCRLLNVKENEFLNISIRKIPPLNRLDLSLYE